MAFWSTTSGVVTGVAGTLTGVVGLATLAAQMGWIGGDGGAEEASSRVETAGEAAGEDAGNRLAEDGDAARGDNDAAPEFAVTPASVRFEALGARTTMVTVRNTGGAEVTVEDVTVDSGDADRFTVAAAACTATTLDPGRSCEVEVAYEPAGRGSARATMVVDVAGAPAREVPLTAASLL
ncbi:MAG TPA: choice-of-anchor D domain-containing protein [Acidimicrobiales bacterium]|jgi:hypothetical protein|nr:choice-of-anchor D domain-containing protein [Acidimicrobiales bacterium]